MIILEIWEKYHCHAAPSSGVTLFPALGYFWLEPLINFTADPASFSTAWCTSQ